MKIPRLHQIQCQRLHHILLKVSILSLVTILVILYTCHQHPVVNIRCSEVVESRWEGSGEGPGLRTVNQQFCGAGVIQDKWIIHVTTSDKQSLKHEHYNYFIMKLHFVFSIYLLSLVIDKIGASMLRSTNL